MRVRATGDVCQQPREHRVVHFRALWQLELIAQGILCEGAAYEYRSGPNRRPVGEGGGDGVLPPNVPQPPFKGAKDCLHHR